LVASLGDYIYGKDEAGIWVNLYVGSNTSLKLGKTTVPVQMETNYPWDGQVKLTMNPDKRTPYTLRMRIPGWVNNVAVPGDLYRFAEGGKAAFTMLVNGKPAQYREENGYAVIDRTWQKGDVVELNLPMEVKRVLAKQDIKVNNDRVALQRGPLVYCVEGIDNNGQAWNMLVPESTTFTTQPHQVSTESVIAIRAEVPVVGPSADGSRVVTETKTITAIPYYSWANRGKSSMQVWLPMKAKQVKINE